MRVRLHLIAPPWAVICSPSVQLGTLQAFVEQQLGAKVQVRSYSAFLEILYRSRESRCFFLYEDFKIVGEEIFMLIYRARYLSQKIPLAKNKVQDYLTALNSHFKWEANTLGFDELETLETQTLAYIDEKIIPELIDDGVNVIGFSMNFSQVYASLVMARMLRERAPDKKLFFLFGGFSASLPHIYSLMERLETPGYTVFGEGEQRLVSVLNDLLAQSKFTGELTASIGGVFRIGEQIDLQKRDESLFLSQLENLESLPLPAYEEYFELYRLLSEKDPLFTRLVPVWVTLEGSRGCFAKCDFCNHNMQWSGFRKLAHAHIFEKIRAARDRYGVNSIYFVDNVSDTFAERLAEQIIQSGEKFRLYMNLRAHHPEGFWTKLTLAGLNQCLIGIESLSSPLLKHMSKGTQVVQNLRVAKNLTELGVCSGSGLITHHPKATEDDARETLRILEHISHLDPLEPNRLLVGVGSPLYKELVTGGIERDLRQRVDVEPPPTLRPWLATGGFDLPGQLKLGAESDRLWSEVMTRCNAQKLRVRGKRPVFNVRQRPDGAVEIKDTRFKSRKIRLTGLRAQIFELCHAGLKREALGKELNLTLPEFEASLEALVTEKLLLLTDGYYLTLATRSKEECLAKVANKLDLRPETIPVSEAAQSAAAAL